MDWETRLAWVVTGVVVGAYARPLLDAVLAALADRWWRRSWTRRYYLGRASMSEFSHTPDAESTSEADQFGAWLADNGLRRVGWLRYRLTEAWRWLNRGPAATNFRRTLETGTDKSREPWRTGRRFPDGLAGADTDDEEG